MEVNFTLSELPGVAKEVLSVIKAPRVIAFYGEMGAGKTTFVQALCTALGVRETVSSPTFSIINQYVGGDGKTIWHIDLYRLKSAAEAIDAGVEDCLYSGNTCLIEWPERAVDLLPPFTRHVHIVAIDTFTRQLTLLPSSPARS